MQSPSPTSTIFFKRLRPEASVPTRGTDLAAGWDLKACLDQPYVIIGPGVWQVIPCGFAVMLPDDFEMQIRPRSGLAVRHGITLLNSPGTIDADYRGEVAAIVHNTGPTAFRVEHGMRIAQAVFARVPAVEWKVVNTLPASKRGEGGYGSTGV